jgi:ankyrin repeat protein
LHLAARWARTAIVENLIRNGANLNTQTKIRRYTPLHVAVYAGHWDIGRVLIEAGADVNDKTFIHGRTPLHIVAREGCDNLVRVLIVAGVNINARDGSKFTALHYATSGGHKDIAKFVG